MTVTEKKLDWFKMYPEKLLNALAGMTPDQGYLYCVILLRIYECDGPCPDSLDVLARRTHMNRKRVAAAKAALCIAGKIIENKEGLSNPFADGCLTERQNLSMNNSLTATQAVKNRWEKTKQKQQKGHTESESDKTLSLALESPRVSKTAQKNKIPKDWTPKEREFLYGIGLGFDQTQIASHADQMANWAQAKGATAEDWDAQFRSWLWRKRDEEKKRKGDHSLTVGPSFTDIATGNFRNGY